MVAAVLIQSLLLAAAGTLSPGSITLVILLLISEEGWRKGTAYVAGYVGAYTLIGLAVLLAGARLGSDRPEVGAALTSGLLIGLGSLLLLVALRNWRQSPTEGDDSPRLFAILDRITPLRALGFGAAVTVINVKNLAIFLSALSVLLLSGLSLATRLALLVPIVLVFCAAVIAPLLVYASFPARAEQRLSRLKEIIEGHRRPIGIWLPLLFGLLFLARGLSTLY